MELNSATTRILSLVRQETGREIEMVADPSLQLLARAKLATGKLTAHVIVYNPNKKAVDYSIAYECGFILRLYESTEEERLQFVSTDAGTNAVRQLVTAPGGIAKRMSLPDPLINQFTGFSSVQNPGFTTDGTRDLEELFGEKNLGFPKPTKLVSLLLSQGTSVANGDLVVDFFAGSGTTAHALLEMNKQDGGNRKFILLQLPEPTGREDYRTIADIAKERLRRVIRKINEHDTGKLDLDGGRDLGFRVFKL